MRPSSIIFAKLTTKLVNLFCGSNKSDGLTQARMKFSLINSALFCNVNIHAGQAGHAVWGGGGGSDAANAVQEFQSIALIVVRSTVILIF